MDIIGIHEFNEYWFEKIPAQKRNRGNQGTKKKKTYKDIITAFDIETTRIKEIEQSVMYVWQWQFGSECCVVGRTWDEFEEFCMILKKRMKGQHLVVFVHNLSYEFSFLKGVYNFKKDEVFAMDARKVAKCYMYGFLEFRCSYIHSNMSLGEYTKKMGVEHAKLSGEEFDYSIERYPWTPLTDSELAYCVHDVLGLVEAIKIDLDLSKDNLYTFPLTSTGYVRRDVKQVMKIAIRYVVLHAMMPSWHLYQMLREGFRGGNTHGSRFHAGEILQNVLSADRSSSYPDVLVNDLFPMGPFIESGRMSLDDVYKHIFVRHHAVIMRIAFYNIRLKEKTWGCPYLTKDKSRDIVGGHFDNGRVLKAEYLETTITDVDFRIILDEYECDEMIVYDSAYARYGRLPRALRELIIKYYKDKTSLKGVKGQELYYNKSKALLNSIYGLMAQDPIRQNIVFENGEFKVEEASGEELLEKANNKAFLPYQWGCWCTSWARYRLEEGIRLCNGAAGLGFVYADTDSCKYMGECSWDEYNKERIKHSKDSGAFATDPQGTTHYMGVYEFDGSYATFATLGAKKYVYTEEPGGPAHVTIAGVNKRKGGAELDAYGGLDAFKPGFTFVDAGGTESIYNDFPPMKEYKIDGHIIPITSNVVIKESTYTLGITAEYERLLRTSSI